MHSKTIVAQATPEGVGGISVIRLSGDDALQVAGRVFENSKFSENPDSHRAVYGILRWPSSSATINCEKKGPIDTVLAMAMIAPHSYTGEDTVELFCHGGKVVSRMIVAACRMAGAEPAAAGEFSKRAFLNGRLSLDQAEAVIDLIHAESEFAATAAVGQLLGGLDKQLSEIENPLLKLLSELEGSLEFVDEEEISVSASDCHQVLTKSCSQISELLSMAPAGKLLREGVHVVFSGPPNVGKSSLFNAMMDEDRAIVDDQAGTTRDVISQRVEYRGLTYVFHDTAGLRANADRVEQMGIERTLRKIEESDVVLRLREFVADNSNDKTLLFDGAKNSAGGNYLPPVIEVVTKSDLDNGSGSVPVFSEETVITSSKNSEGINFVWDKIEEIVEQNRLKEALGFGVILNERHRHKLENCRLVLLDIVAQLEPVEEENNACPDSEIIGTLLASVLSQLGEVSGRVFSEKLLGTVFSRFCVGK